LRIIIFALEAKDSAAGYDAEPRNSRKVVDNAFDNFVGQIIVRDFCGTGREWKNGEALHVVGSGSGLAQPEQSCDGHGNHDSSNSNRDPQFSSRYRGHRYCTRADAMVELERCGERRGSAGTDALSYDGLRASPHRV